MRRCLNKVVIAVFFLGAFAAGNAYALPDSLSLPSPLLKKLAHYRQKDDLEYWIYERIMYVDKDPVSRIGFLMHSQQEAWRMYKTYYERLAWFDLLSVQGYYQLQTGNILASINAYETALAFYESYPLPDADVIETVLKPLGNNYTRLADYPAALFIYHKTMSLALKANNRLLIASTYSNMAICASSQNELTAAATYCREGLRYTSPQTALYGLLLGTRANVLFAQQQYDSAAIICSSALKKLQKHQQEGPTLIWYTDALQVAAKIALQKQQYPKAAAYANQALQLFHQYYPATKQREKAKLQVLLGDICLKTGNTTRSLTCYQQALQLLIPDYKPVSINTIPEASQLYSENTLLDALYGKAAALTQLHQPVEALQHYTSAFIAAGKLRKAFFYTDSKLKEITENRSQVEAAAILAYNQWITTGNRYFVKQLLLITEMSRAQVLMDERHSRMKTPELYLPGDSLLRRSKQLQKAITYYQHELLTAKDRNTISNLLQQAEYDLSLLNKSIKQQSPLARDEGNMLSIKTLDDIIQHIPPQVTVLEFVAGSDSSFLLELNNKGIQSVQLIEPGKTIQNEISAFMHHWFAGGPAAMMNEPRNFYTTCYRLYQNIFKNRAWEKQRHYVLVTDGAFNYLPFDALLTHPSYQNNFRGWPYLFKQAVLSQAYSLTTWFEQQSAQYPSNAFTGFFVSKGQNTRQVALSIDEEYQALHKMISGNYFSNSSATWNAFDTITGATGILHISTHSVSSAADSFPYLQLYDKPFYLFDLRYKRFSPALVVLSACKTADGSLLEGEGLNSISRGFTAAGAGGVISSLWNVNDETAITLMQHFYKQLATQPNVSLALHNAKSEWLQADQENALLQLPYYWAGFIYSGHLQKVTVPANQPGRSYYWFAALLVLPGIWFLAVRKKTKKYFQSQ